MSKRGEEAVKNIKHTQKLIGDRKSRDEKIVELKQEITEHLDTIAGLTNENEVLTAKLEKHAQAQRDGYLTVALDKDGMVVHIAEVQGYSDYTYIQDIPEIYYKKNYQRFKVLKLDKGRITIDKQKLKKYKSIGVI